MIALSYCYEWSWNRPGWGIIDLQADTPVSAWDRHDQNERETRRRIQGSGWRSSWLPARTAGGDRASHDPRGGARSDDRRPAQGLVSPSSKGNAGRAVA